MIETQGTHTRGMTVGDLRTKTDREPNVNVLLDVDRDAFIRLIYDALAILDARVEQSPQGILNMAGWTDLRETVRLELLQRGEEGCDTQGLMQKWDEAAEDEDKLQQLYQELMELQVSADFPLQNLRIWKTSVLCVQRALASFKRTGVSKYGGINSTGLGSGEVLGVH